MKSILSKDAEKDISDIIDYFLQDNIKIANDFVNDFDEACGMLEKFPDIGYKASEEIIDISIILKDSRKWQLKKFKQYIIFYKKEKDAILIIRVVNGKRDIPNMFSDWAVD